MASIEIRRYSLAGPGHLYYELIGDNGKRIAQINAFGTNPITGQGDPLAPDVNNGSGGSNLEVDSTGTGSHFQTVATITGVTNINVATYVSNGNLVV